MRPLFIPSRCKRIADALQIFLCAALLAFCLAGADAITEGFNDAVKTQPTYASFGYAGEARAIASSHASDDMVCRDLHGDGATAQQRPDGSHRCVDKHGRRLPNSVITIPSHTLAKQ